MAFGVPAQGRLKRVDLSSGFVQPIGTINDAFPGGAWGLTGTIVFSPDSRVVLQRVSASGGTAEPATVLDLAKRENSHRFPHLLPDGQHFLFTARSDVRENTGIYLGRLGSMERTWLVEAESSASYAAPGYIPFVREGMLLAQPFALAALRLSGERSSSRRTSLKEPLERERRFQSQTMDVWWRIGSRPPNWPISRGSIVVSNGMPGRRARALHSRRFRGHPGLPAERVRGHRRAVYPITGGRARPSEH